MTELREVGPIIGLGATAEIYALDDDRVLKLIRPEYTDTADIIVEMEANASELVAAADLPAPRYYGKATFEDRKGIILERLHGQNMLGRAARRPHELPRLCKEFAALHLQIHQYDIPKLKPYRGYLTHQINSTPALSEANKTQLIHYLSELPDRRQVVCHGDLHPGNVMLTAKGPIVIDWYSAVRGDPAADVARTILAMGIGTPAGGENIATRLFVVLARRLASHVYRSNYFKKNDVTPTEVENWMPVLAAARLKERRPGEQEALLKLVRLAY